MLKFRIFCLTDPDENRIYWYSESKMNERSTIQREVQISGIGIHSGKNVHLRLRPFTEGKIVFRRTDLGNLGLTLDWRKIEAENNSSLVSKECKIQTLEHFLAVLYILGIDSLLVEMDGEEIPIMDGSASPLFNTLLEAGLKALPQKKKSIKILKSFTLEEKEASVSFLPDSEFRITYGIEFDHPLIRRQEASYVVNSNTFRDEIAPARTFGFLKDVPALRTQGLALGGSLENVLVLDEEGIINGPLRFPDEFVRHKILDFIGDLSLTGHPLLGHFKAHKAGHSLHLRAVHFLLENPDLWSFD